MKLLRQFGIVLAIWLLGEALHQLLYIPIPGSVLGMLILFLCLCTGIIKVEMLEEISRFLLDHLAFFFVPAGVGLITSMKILKADGLAILGISIVTTILVLGITGQTVQFIKRRYKK